MADRVETYGVSDTVCHAFLSSFTVYRQNRRDIVLMCQGLKRDDFRFDVVNFPFVHCDVPRCPSYGF